MMRPIIILASISLAAAGKSSCAVDGAKAVNEATDAAIFVWAASKRCGIANHSQVKCEIDITSAVESSIQMLNVIVEAVNDCGDIETENHKCGEAAAELTASIAGLSASAGGIADACPNALGQPHDSVGLGETTHLGKCVVDAKNVVGSLFRAMKKLSKINKECDDKDDEDCSSNALKVVSALANLGEFLAASVNDCSSFNGAGNAVAACASHVLGLVSDLHHLAHRSIKMADKCHTSDSRLYAMEHGVAVHSQSMTYALGAFLPISAVFSFILGLRMASVRRRETRQFGFQEADAQEE